MSHDLSRVTSCSVDETCETACEAVKNQVNQLMTKLEVGFAAISDKQFAYCALISSSAMAAIFATVRLWGTATWQVNLEGNGFPSALEFPDPWGVCRCLCTFAIQFFNILTCLAA